MKISKLFHWLYAILMMLPVFFIGGRMIYVAFNKNAKDSYYGETINETVYTELSTLSDYDANLTYNLRPFSFPSGTTLSGTQNAFTVENLIYNGTSFSGRRNIQFWRENSNLNYLYINIYGVGGVSNIASNSASTIMSFNIISTTMLDTIYNNFTTKFTQISYNEYSYLDNVFSRSVNEINTNPLFAWAKDSFLVTPFRYITNLFGMPSDSPIITLLSYWLDISIIYLVFDVVMYLPLLAHRWIDKGMIE